MWPSLYESFFPPFHLVLASPEYRSVTHRRYRNNEEWDMWYPENSSLPRSWKCLPRWRCRRWEGRRPGRRTRICRIYDRSSERPVTWSSWCVVGRDDRGRLRQMPSAYPNLLSLLVWTGSQSVQKRCKKFGRWSSVVLCSHILFSCKSNIKHSLWFKVWKQRFKKLFLYLLKKGGN